VLPVALVAWLACAAAGAAQGGLGWRAAALAPDLSRLNPGKGLARLFEARSAGRLVFTVAKLFVGGACLWWVLAQASSPERFREVGGATSLGQLWGTVWTEIVAVGWRAAAALLALAGADYTFQRWLNERELRMTRAEVLEEVARIEGQPELKRRRQRLGRERILRSPRRKEG
jgi:flagellar biosynthetic protein FlhB